MKANANVPLFYCRNDKGEALDICAWGGGHQLKVWLPKDESQKSRYVSISVQPEVLCEMTEDAIRVIKENMGFSISKMVTKWDGETRTSNPHLLWTVKKEMRADYVYDLTIDFPVEGKTFNFPFKRPNNITCTSETESVEDVSLRMLKRFVEVLRPSVTVFSKSDSKGEKPSQTKVNSDTALPPSSGFGGSPTNKDLDIPY